MTEGVRLSEAWPAEYGNGNQVLMTVDLDLCEPDGPEVGEMFADVAGDPDVSLVDIQFSGVWIGLSPFMARRLAIQLFLSAEVAEVHTVVEKA